MPYMEMKNIEERIYQRGIEFEDTIKSLIEIDGSGDLIEAAILLERQKQISSELQFLNAFDKVRIKRRQKRNRNISK